MPLVSVIIPAYNSGHYLDEAVQSVIAQTFTDWECIVVDDGSTEDLSRVGKMDPRVRLIRQRNRGVACARNVGITSAGGVYIAFLDHDDLWLPNKLSCQVAVMEKNPGAGLCHHLFEIADASGLRQAGALGGETVASYLEMLEKGGPLPTVSMFTKEAAGSAGLLDPLYRAGEDHEFFLNIARLYEVKFIPSVLAIYRVHGTNASRNYMESVWTLRNIAEKHARAARSCGDRMAEAAAGRMFAFRRRQFGAQAYDAARGCLGSGRAWLVAVHLLRALRWAPGYVSLAIAHYAAGCAHAAARRACALLRLRR